MKIFKGIVAVLLASLVIAGCGGGANTLTGQSSSTSGTKTATPASIVASSNVSAIFADGSTTATITVIALDSNHNALANAAVKFAASSGALQNAQAVTDATGAATATLTTGFDPTVRSITVSASSAAIKSNSVVVNVIGSANVAPVSHLNLVSSIPAIAGDGSTTATITAYALDANYGSIANVPVAFSASSGGITAETSITDASGTAHAILSAAGDPTPRAIKVTATAGGVTQSVSVNVTAASILPVQMGSVGAGGAPFQAGVLGLQTSTLSAGGSMVVQAVLEQSDGTLYTAQPVSVTFSSPCVAQNLATLTPASVQTNNGGASTTYTANGCSGSDTITARATVNNVSISASGTVKVAPPSVGSISFVSASPTIIALQGVGSTTGLPEQSVVTFKVLDQNGNAYANAPVSFSLSTAVGGLSLLSTSGTSATDGTVRATVKSGSVAGPVSVIATVAIGSSTVTTQSSQLIVSTGLPAQASFTVAPSDPVSKTCPNVEALGMQGDLTVKLTATVSDRFNNPVPDGTAISFHTDSGQIQGQCFTAGAPVQSSCSVTWTNELPNPPYNPGLVGILGVTIGEESFTDSNGNGQYDAGEPWQDVGEPFIPTYADGLDPNSYDTRDYYYDFNGNGVHDGPNGRFDGVLCNDPLQTGVCGSKTTAVGAFTKLITSGSVPTNVSVTTAGQKTKIKNGDGLPAPLSISAGSGIYAFTLADVNNNPMPAGTTISLTAQSNVFSITGQSSYKVGCETLPGSYAFFLLPASATVGASGTVILTVTTPKNVTTQYLYTVVLGT
jgi:hypothetical protein